MTNGKRYWAPVTSRFGTFAAWVDAEGRLLRFHLRAKGAAAIDPEAERNEKKLAQVQRQVTEYDGGKRREFDLELVPAGPEFHKQVWNALLEIPFGETTSYGAIARRVGQANAARAVGVANGANPIALVIPCHRVIGSDGSLTGYGGGLPLKRALLEHEACVVGRPLDLFAQRPRNALLLG
ncbi:MAG: methylated-DNA--[protein]-cysteine S-methyltransferase [Alphaproteobacteria bacterium]|nr:methylated-DNA--[protein]-cysteine S-methyltransferase [Alphaproteobacteria bacterium]